MLKESNYLAHYGVKGMKWGVRRYQPYGYKIAYGHRASIKTQGRHAKAMNDIFDSLTENQKTLVNPEYRIDKSQKLINDGEMFPALSVIKMYKNTPVSVVAAWNSGNGKGEIALATNSKFQGKGLASKTVKKFMSEFGKSKISDIKTLYWSPWETNEASKKLAVKSGFKFDSKRDGWETYKYSIKND